MPCNRCGGVVIIGRSTGGDSGHFSEQYECHNCGATGIITGNSDTPRSVTKTGPVFE